MDSTGAADTGPGPLPQRGVGESESRETAGFGQVTPGAVTPAWAGSSEQYYAASGVGDRGPQHLSGPPPVTDPGRSTAWMDSLREAARSGPLLVLILAGAATGLALFAYWRLRSRPSRIERLRMRVRLA